MFFFLINILFAQEIKESYGFIQIKSDSNNVPVFIDEIYIGDTPLEECISVKPGFHEVSLLPPELASPLLKKRLTDSISNIFVEQGDTVEVFLSVSDQEDQIHALRGESIISQYVGWMMMGVTVFLLMLIAG